jgi:tetratricopeptide (TPR) repeat protein
MSAKTVFISYRRDPTGRAFARSIKQELTGHGYDVFFDVDSIASGRWAEQLLTQVPSRSHFLLLLTPGALDRCTDKDDWVRQEFEIAVQHRRNIVPILEESVVLAGLKDACPEAMSSVFNFQIATVRNDGFEGDIQDLITRYIPPHKAPAIEEETYRECVVSPTRLHHGADHLFGREQELAALDELANDPSKKVLTIVAFGGVGKTALVIEWMAQQAARNWQGFERVFDWSFFSQGTREQGGASADPFIAAALRFFGDDAMADSAASAWDKGARLAQLISQQRSLLVLDGIEPLQHPPGPLAGELKDPALATLLKGLARQNSGLCIVTTRERVTDLAAFRNTTAPEWELHHLSSSAGVELLKNLRVRGTPAELEEAVKEVKGHALTLNLLGRYLAKAHQGDIRRRDQVKFETADSKIQGGYAFKTIGAYEKWLSGGGEDGARALAVLRLLGLFDRPADAGCLNALRDEPAIEGLTELCIGLSDVDWNLAVSALSECGLVSYQVDELAMDSVQAPLDAHPLVREYFAKQLSDKNPSAWRAAHRRIYEHLRTTTEDKAEPTLEDLQPLYQAIAHGCLAGLYEEAGLEVYRMRIHRSEEIYPIRKLGAYGTELSAITSFFETLWTQPVSALSLEGQGWLLNQAAFSLLALGRLIEAREPMQSAISLALKRSDWKNAAVSAGNLCTLELRLGNVKKAITDAEKSVTYADQSGDEYEKASKRARLAHAFHQAGRFPEAEALFREAEQMQAKLQSNLPLLYSVSGFQFCDLLLARAERSAWQSVARLELSRPRRELEEDCRTVAMRAAETLRWALDASLDILSPSLGYLTLGRSALYQAILESVRDEANDLPLSPQQETERLDKIFAQPFNVNVEESRRNLKAAVVGLRRSGNMDDLADGLLTHCWSHFLNGAGGRSENAQADLDEAWEIAERGHMKLIMADIHLYRARLFGPFSKGRSDAGRGIKYPWDTRPDGSPRGPKDDLDEARKLIEQCGYWRRKEELKDAEEAAKNW